MLQLNVLFAYYPGMVFLHVLRNPLDMAYSYKEHLSSVSSEFKALHGGNQQAAKLMNERCEKIILKMPVIRTVENCAVAPKNLANMSFPLCTQNVCGRDKTPPSAWSCLHVMLWAEINPAVRAWGDHCLRSSNRYTYYHGEDSYSLRGAGNTTRLAEHLAGIIHVPLWTVVKVFEEQAAEAQSRRELSYGKYRGDANFDAALTAQCAEVARPGVLASFGYKEGT
jgi:hypothetical protein